MEKGIYTTLDTFDEIDLHVPDECPKCGGTYVYSGVGEYVCDKCKDVAYDDYGKVRNYLDHHPGANITQVEKETGVTKKAIRRLIEDDRLSVRRN